LEALGITLPPLTQGNTTIPTIKNLQIPLPPLEKQTEIADHISALRLQAKQFTKRELS
jgi:type I restriction enzyme M protein